jgi:hypothetical protein
MASALVATAIGAAPWAQASGSVPTKAHQPVATPPRAPAQGFNGANAEGRIANLTPYTWTLVQTGADNTNVTFWESGSIPSTVKPGESFVYRIRPQASYATTQKYNGFFTYKADAVNHTEYLTVNVEGAHCTGICLERDGPPLVVQMFNKTRAPTHNNVFIWDFGPDTPNAEIGSTSSGSTYVWPPNHYTDFDLTFQTRGNYTLDAAKSPPQLAALINAMCAGSSGTMCSFTAMGDIHWGIGDLDKQASVKSCGAEPPTSSSGEVRNPPKESPDWHEVTVEAKRKRSVSVGGSIEGGAEVHLFGVIDSEVSAKVGIEHEWSDTKTFEKTTRIYVPQNWLAAVWVAPVVGKVSGTLVVKTSLASYTITNFEETASGVSKDLTTPAFDIMTYSRQMTADEYMRLCPKVSTPPIGLG